MVTPRTPGDPRLTVWPALLLAPLLALGHLSLAYALVTPSCARQDGAGLHGLAAVSLVLALAMTLLAWRDWHLLPRHDDVTTSDATQAGSRSRFVALVATLVGAFSSLVIAAMWLPLWLLSPCA
jgi:hypothetical protein